MSSSGIFFGSAKWVIRGNVLKPFGRVFQIICDGIAVRISDGIIEKKLKDFLHEFMKECLKHFLKKRYGRMFEGISAGFSKRIYEKVSKHICRGIYKEIIFARILAGISTRTRTEVSEKNH